MVFDGGVMIVLLPMTAAHQYTLTSWTLWSAGLPDKECRGQTMKGDLYAFDCFVNSYQSVISKERITLHYKQRLHASRREEVACYKVCLENY